MSGAVVLLVGAGAVGARAARQLTDTPGIDRVLVVDRRATHAEEVVAAMGRGPSCSSGTATARFPEGVTAVACALPAGCEQPIASRALEAGVPFASSGDDESDLMGLRSLTESARRSGVAIIAGCGLAPGLADVLARHAADAFDEVDEIGVARAGTSGDACDRDRDPGAAGAVGRAARRVYEESRRRGGHELVWFPEPIGPRECERVATGVHLLSAAVPDARGSPCGSPGDETGPAAALAAPAGSRGFLGRDPGRGVGPAGRGARADRLRRDRTHRDRGGHGARGHDRRARRARSPACWRRAPGCSAWARSPSRGRSSPSSPAAG